MRAHCSKEQRNHLPRPQGRWWTKVKAEGQEPDHIQIYQKLEGMNEEVYCCRLPAHFHGLDGQSGWMGSQTRPEAKVIENMTHPHLHAQQSQSTPLRARKGLCRTLCRWGEMSLSGSQGFLLLGSGRDEDENWECVTFHESSSLGHHALYTRTLPLLLESVGVGPGKEGPSVWPQALQSSIQSMIRTARTRVIIIQGENPLQPQICWQNLWIHH